MKNQLFIYALAALAMGQACKNAGDYSKSVDDYLQLDSTTLEIATVADSLQVPWELAYHKDKLIFTEIAGTVKQLDLKTGKVKQLLHLTDVFQKRSTGLLGISVQKTDAEHPYVILNYTTKKDSVISSKLVRYEYATDTLIHPTQLLEIRGNTAHNGTRLHLTQKDIIYWATGDAYDFPTAQDSTSLNGKILRINLDGSIPQDNPIPNSYVYAWGFRNMQGLTIDERGNIFTSEHGDAIEDEVNHILPIHNYGWPLFEGSYDTRTEAEKKGSTTAFTAPLRTWGPPIAPSGLAFYDHDIIPEWKNSLLLGTLKNQSLRILHLADDRKSILSEKVFLTNRYGRIRAMCVAPNGDIFLTTSNRDWNPQPGFPKPTDDRIIRLRPVKKALKDNLLTEDKPATPAKVDGAVLYKNYCASCHKEDGLGVKNSFPPLKGSARVKDSNSLLTIVLKGLDGKQAIDGVKYGTMMPSFAFIKDEELSSLLSYISKQFGSGTSITANQIKQKR